MHGLALCILELNSEAKDRDTREMIMQKAGSLELMTLSDFPYILDSYPMPHVIRRQSILVDLGESLIDLQTTVKVA